MPIMLRPLKLPIMTIVLAITMAPVARGEMFQGFHRSLGIWWSDGYHATTRPPPQARHGHYGSPAWHGAGSWQYESSSPLEYLPSPAVPPESSSGRVAPVISRQPANASRPAR
jgi:hypothetical protein